MHTVALTYYVDCAGAAFVCVAGAIYVRESEVNIEGHTYFANNSATSDESDFFSGGGQIRDCSTQSLLKHVAANVQDRSIR